MSSKFGLTEATNLFKIKFGKLSDATFNAANVIFMRMKRDDTFTGKRLDIAVPTSFAGGVGSGSLPSPNVASYEDAQISSKKVYSVIEIEREAIKAAETDEGAFVRMTKEPVRKGVESFNRNMSRILFNDGTGTLGVTTAVVAGGSAASPTVIISAATWKEANFEERDYINVDSVANPYAVGNVWEIVTVTPSTKTLLLSRVLGSVDLTADAGAKTLIMQNSKDNDPLGLKGVLDATSGTLYGVTVARRWQAYQKAAAGAGITVDLLNEGMLGVERQCGKVPNMIVSSYTQYRKILNQLEDQKQYIIEPRSPELKGMMSFKAVEFMSNAGPVPIVVDRFLEDDRVYLLNDNYITLYSRPGGPQWFDDDGTVLLRKDDSDDYAARFGMYGNFYIPPAFHGKISGLST